jgi:hypothetical protein
MIFFLLLWLIMQGVKIEIKIGLSNKTFLL